PPPDLQVFVLGEPVGLHLGGWYRPTRREYTRVNRRRAISPFCGSETAPVAPFPTHKTGIPAPHTRVGYSVARPRPGGRRGSADSGTGATLPSMSFSPADRGSEKQKRLPVGNRRSYHTSPPMARASRRAMGRPRPIPDEDRASPLDSCSKCSKIFSTASSGTPGPLSATTMT